ncbi:unnamed protein product, partial [Durusdinium trenchii]
MSAFLGDLSIVRSSCLPPLRLLAVPMPLGSREGRGGTGHRGGRFLCAAIAAPVVLGCWTVRRRSRQSMRSSEQPEWVPTKEVLAELASSERPIGYYCLREADSETCTICELRSPTEAERRFHLKINGEVQRFMVNELPFSEGKLGGHLWDGASHEDLFGGEEVLELGSGIGLLGITVSCLASSVVLSDFGPTGEEDGRLVPPGLLDNLRQNVVLNKITNAEVKHIDWHDFLHISSAATFRRLIAADVVYYSADLPALAATIGAHLCEGGRADILTVRRDWRGPLASERATAEDLAAALTVYGHVTVTELLGYCCTFEEVPLALITLTRDSRVESRDKRHHQAPEEKKKGTSSGGKKKGFTEEIKPGVGFFELWDIEDTTGPKLRVDVEMLAAANPEHFGRKLIDGNTVSLIPDLLCAGGCQELESGITYFLMTSNAGVVYDMMDNPLPMLDTNRSRSWSFYVNENVTRAPEVLRTSFAINSTEAVTEVHGYLYFAQRVFQNGSFPDTVRQASEIQIQDCGADFDCSHSQVVEPVTVQVEPWSSQRLGLEPGLVHFSFEVPDVPHRFQVTVLPWSFMGADTRKGSLAGPSQPYTFMLETGSDPSIPPERPFILPGGVFPSGPEPVAANSNVTMVFSEEVLAGSGNISFCVDLVEDRCSLGRFADGSWATLELSAATVERRKVTWQLEEFAFGQSLQILMPEGLFLSADDRRVPVSYSSGEYRFRIREGDVMPPQVIAIEATERRNGTVQMIFSEAVLFEGDMGNEGVLELATSKGMADFHATVDGAVVTIHGPFATGESYGLRYAAEAALMDLANNRAISVPMDSEIFAISDDTEGPEAHLPVPHLLQMHEVFYIMFDEPVHPGLSHCQLESLPPSYCGLTCGRSEVLVNLRAMVHHFEQGGHMRSMIQVDPGRYLLPGVEYRLTVQPGFIEDSVGNLCEGVEATYKVDLRRDLIPPQLLLATINGFSDVREQYCTFFQAMVVIGVRNREEKAPPVPVARRSLWTGALLLASPANAQAPQKVLVAGATGQTGRRIVERLAKDGQTSVVGGVRDVSKAQSELSKSSIAIRGAMIDEVKAVDTKGVELKSLDVAKDSVDALAGSLTGVDALIIATGFVPGNPFAMNAEAHAVDNLGTKALVDAAKKSGVKKIVLVSSILTNGRGWGQENSPGFQVTNAFGNVLDEKLEAEKYLRASGIDYTIVRPGGLKASAPAGGLVVSKEDTLNSGEISRDLVADVSIAAIFDQRASNKVVEIIEDETKSQPSKDKWLVVEVERFQDLAGNPAMGAGDSLVFQVARAQAESTMDLTVLASLPMDGQTMVPMTSSLQLVFDRMVQAGPGHFLLLPEIE